MQSRCEPLPRGHRRGSQTSRLRMWSSAAECGRVRSGCSRPQVAVWCARVWSGCGRPQNESPQNAVERCRVRSASGRQQNEPARNAIGSQLDRKPGRLKMRSDRNSIANEPAQMHEPTPSGTPGGQRESKTRRIWGGEWMGHRADSPLTRQLKCTSAPQDCLGSGLYQGKEAAATSSSY